MATIRDWLVGRYWGWRLKRAIRKAVKETSGFVTNKNFDLRGYDEIEGLYIKEPDETEER